MWGIRVIRAGMIALAVVACVSGCKTCQYPMKARAEPVRAAGDDKDAEKVLSEWKRTPADWGFNDQTKPLTPERIHGGIY